MEEIWTSRPAGKDEHYPLLSILCAGISYWKQQDHFNRLSVPEAELGIEYILEGEAVFVRDGISHTIPKGKAFIFLSSHSNSYSCGNSGLLIKRFATLRGGILDSVISLSHIEDLICFQPTDSYVFLQLLEQAAEVLKQPVENSSEASVIAWKLLLQLQKAAEKPLHPTLQKAIHFIHQHLDTSYTLEYISHYIGVSSTHLNRLFTKEFGVSTIAYHQQQRLLWARNLLLSTQWSIKEIAGKTGYNDPLYFSSRFKKQFGISPKLFQKQYRAQLPE